MMSNYELRITNYDGVAARNIARDMLSGEALTAWLGGYPGLPVAEPRNVLVIMAGNIPFVGMHDLICVLAAGHRAIVKPSSRDRENMEWVVEQLLDIDPHTPISMTFPSSPPSEGCPEGAGWSTNEPIHAIIAMGSNATIAAIAERYPNLPTLLRGSRSSLAVLTGRETADELEGLADDMLLYSGLGCRSVSLLWVPRGYDFGPLGGVLARREGMLPELWRGSLRQVRALMLMTGVSHLDTGAVLLVGTTPPLRGTPPQEGNQGAVHFPHRPGVVNYVFYDDMAEVIEWITKHKDEIQCVAGSPPSEGWTRSGRGGPTKTTKLGQTQHPRLKDYPDGRDTMQFLSKI